MNLRAIEALATTLGGRPEVWQDSNSSVAVDIANSKTDVLSALYCLFGTPKYHTFQSVVIHRGLGGGHLFDGAIPK